LVLNWACCACWTGGGEGGQGGRYFSGARQDHRSEGGAFGGLPVGFPADDILGDLGDFVVATERRETIGVDVASVVAARADGEVAPGDAEVEDLVEVRAIHGQPGGGEAERVGERRLRGLGDVDVVGFFFEPAVERGRIGVVELRPEVIRDGAVGGVRRVVVGLCGGFECAQDGRCAVGQAAVGHWSSFF
jgi:hypothetical protein